MIHEHLISYYDCSRARVYLECPPHAKDTVVCLLRRQTLERKLHGFALLGDEVVGSA